jgi:hypothetical protein
MRHILLQGISQKSFVSPLHITLGFIKISVQAMDKESEVFAYLRKKFPKVSGAKMNEGIFFIPQITQPFDDQDFSTKLTSTTKRRA